MMILPGGSAARRRAGAVMGQKVITTTKGYTLTPAQTARRELLVPMAQNGPDYVRGVRDNLAGCFHSEDHEQVDHFLTRAEACVPGSPAITAVIRTVEPAAA